MFVCCECCALSGRSLCHELITRPEESYRLWCVIVCDLENIKNEEAMTRVGSQRHREKKIVGQMKDLMPVVCLRFFWKLELSRQIFRNYSNIKFHENSPVGSRVFPCGRADMTQLIAAFQNFANAPQNNTKANVLPGTVFIP